jgi:hypothetical protein
MLVLVGSYGRAVALIKRFHFRFRGTFMNFLKSRKARVLVAAAMFVCCGPLAALNNWEENEMDAAGGPVENVASVLHSGVDFACGGFLDEAKEKPLFATASTLVGGASYHFVYYGLEELCKKYKILQDERFDGKDGEDVVKEDKPFFANNVFKDVGKLLFVGGQVLLPFIGVALTAKFKAEGKFKVAALSAATQAVGFGVIKAALFGLKNKAFTSKTNLRQALNGAIALGLANVPALFTPGPKPAASGASAGLRMRMPSRHGQPNLGGWQAQAEMLSTREIDPQHRPVVEELVGQNIFHTEDD